MTKFTSLEYKACSRVLDSFAASESDTPVSHITGYYNTQTARNKGMICIMENAEINGIESSTEIKQNKDSNLLLVHHDIYSTEYRSFITFRSAVSEL